MFNFFRKNNRTPPVINDFRDYVNLLLNYEVDEEKAIIEIYKNPFSSACITRINEALNNLTWGIYRKGYKDNVTEIKDSFVARTLQEPSKILNIDQFISYFALYYILYGELLVMRVDLFTKSELIIFKKGSYHIEMDTDNVLNGIKNIRIGTKEYKGDELKQFYYIKNINIYDNIAGAGFGNSRVKSLSMLHDYYCLITRWNNELLKNSGKREVFLLFKNFLNIHKKKEILDEFQKNSGAKNVGKAMIVDGDDVSIVNGDFAPRDFDFLNALDEIRNITSNIFNVPSILIGDRTNSKFSNYKEAKKDLYTENIIPMAQQIAEYLTQIFKDKLGANEYIDFDTRNIEVLKQDKNEIMAMLNSIQFLTINEKRAELEYPAVENGDEIWLNGMYTALSEMGTEAPLEPNGDEEDEEVDIEPEKATDEKANKGTK